MKMNKHEMESRTGLREEENTRYSNYNGRWGHNELLKFWIPGVVKAKWQRKRNQREKLLRRSLLRRRALQRVLLPLL